MVRLFVREIFFVILVSDIVIASKILFVQLKRCSNSLKFLFRKHAFTWNKASDLSLFGIFIVCTSSVSWYLDWATFSGSVLSSGEALLLNWLTKSFKFSKGLNKREASLFVVLPGSLLAYEEWAFKNDLVKII